MLKAIDSKLLWLLLTHAVKVGTMFDRIVELVMLEALVQHHLIGEQWMYFVKCILTKVVRILVVVVAENRRVLLAWNVLHRIRRVHILAIRLSLKSADLSGHLFLAGIEAPIALN